MDLSFRHTDLIAAVREALVVSTRASHAHCQRLRRRDELVRLYRNVFVRTGLLTDLHRVLNPFELLLTAHLARTMAVGIHARGRGALSHASALLAHGVELDRPALTAVHLVSLTGAHGPDTAPAVRLPGGRVLSSCPVIRHCCDNENPPLVYPVLDVPCLPLDLAAVQCAASLDPRQAVICASGALRALSGFSRFDLETSRERESIERARLLAVLEDRVAPRGRRRARAVLAASDAGCESVPERSLLWMLKAAGFSGARTQVEHRVAGRRFFVDFQIDSRRGSLAIEFDGKGKYGRESGEILSSLTARDQREKLLVSSGLPVVRFEGFELRDPRRVVEEICLRLGLAKPPHAPKALGYPG
ncbi:hypothetical protein M3T53_00765 [Actinomyces sp. B33]|uniref:hypothetical protein n=1 Tax=Actinomyces sp. B33 TaxID=2942131 RepID=UPI0023422D13|nr:hypothetical protein [Actinomyces sp. B33]MDC4232249.1 hypothetical protein [Actinomyces sp. B33]